MPFVFLWLACGVIAYSIGEKKGEGCSAFFIGLIFGPLGILAAMVSKDRRKITTCYYCREEIHPEALICPHCRQETGVSRAAETEEDGASREAREKRAGYRRVSWRVGVALLVVGVGMADEGVQKVMHGGEAYVEGSGSVLRHTFWGHGSRVWTPGKALPVGLGIAALGAGILVAGAIGSKKAA